MAYIVQQGCVRDEFFSLPSFLWDVLTLTKMLQASPGQVIYTQGMIEASVGRPWVDEMGEP